MEHSSAFTPTVFERWRKRENLLPGAILVVLATAGWAYTAYQASTMGGMDNVMRGIRISTMGGVVPFILGWTAMMVAMMIPATLPLILLYRVVARQRLSLTQARVGTATLFTGYIGVWATAGLPVYAYALTAETMRSFVAVLPALLLIVGGIYQFTGLKNTCHARCSSPLFFLMQKWRPGAVGGLRLGALHGIDCLGCCAGLMVGLVALGMMNLALVFTAALIIFAEKTLPDGHRIARPLGVLMVAGGVVFFGLALFGATEPMMNDPGMRSGPNINSDSKMEQGPGMDSEMESGAGMDSI